MVSKSVNQSTFGRNCYGYGNIKINDKSLAFRKTKIKVLNAKSVPLFPVGRTKKREPKLPLKPSGLVFCLQYANDGLCSLVPLNIVVESFEESPEGQVYTALNVHCRSVDRDFGGHAALGNQDSARADRDLHYDVVYSQCSRLGIIIPVDGRANGVTDVSDSHEGTSVLDEGRRLGHKGFVAGYIGRSADDEDQSAAAGRD